MTGAIVPEFLIKEEILYELKTHGISPVQSTFAELRRLMRSALQANTVPDIENLGGIDFDKLYDCCVEKLFTLIELVENVEDDQSSSSIPRTKHRLAHLGRYVGNLLMIAKDELSEEKTKSLQNFIEQV
ncbi:hypothetical protein PR048_002507 [Dryococelus australis]|uniref:Uncharacterized protein n=1 Tax=Dryococelus australis TaxID=614101 RepID=A0ABQ9IKH9_9NEOP|nr:hypothetical protein PR048_002507 [Dryococelus australis]